MRITKTIALKKNFSRWQKQRSTSKASINKKRTKLTLFNRAPRAILDVKRTISAKTKRICIISSIAKTFPYLFTTDLIRKSESEQAGELTII